MRWRKKQNLIFDNVQCVWYCTSYKYYGWTVGQYNGRYALATGDGTLDEVIRNRNVQREKGKSMLERTAYEKVVARMGIFHTTVDINTKELGRYGHV